MFEDNKVEVLEWPRESPSTDPTEHLWQNLKRAEFASTDWMGVNIYVICYCIICALILILIHQIFIVLFQAQTFYKRRIK